MGENDNNLFNSGISVSNEADGESELYTAADGGSEAILEDELKEHYKNKPKKSKMLIFFIVLLILILALTGFRLAQAMLDDTETEKEPPTNVAVQAAEIGNISVTAPVSGKITANDEASVAVTLGGKVTALNVEVGDYVNSGSLLYSVEATQSEEAYNQAILSCETAQANLSLLKTNLDRTQALYDEGAVSLSDLQSLQMQYDTAVLTAKKAESGLIQAQSALDMANVTAPISGYVSTVNLTKGTYAMAGSVAVVITDISKLKVTASISEYMISSVNKGDTVQISVKSATDTPIAGTVTNVAKSPAMGSLTYPVEISFSNSNGLIKAGMFAEVEFTSSVKRNVVKVPSQAVVIKSGRSIVVVVNDSKVEIREVKTGIDNGDTVEITSGLSGGETIAVKGQTYVNDGETVNVVE